MTTISVDALQYPVPARRWFEEWKAGGVGCVHVTVAIWENARDALSKVYQWNRCLADNGDLARRATNGDEIREIAAEGKTAVVYGFQNTAPFEHDIELVGLFHSLGVRIAQLTYNLQNYVGSGYWEASDSGLSSRFGRNVVREMNAVGMLIDLSHCGDRTAIEAIEASEVPVAITHANPRELAGDVNFGAGRLKPFSVIRALVERGGVIGLSPNRNLIPHGADTTIERFCQLVRDTVDEVGIDGVGLGTDYCAGHPPSVRTWWRYARWSRETVAETVAPHEGWQDWFRSPAQMDSLAEMLREHGFTDDETRKIMGENWVRLFDEVFTS